MLTRTETYDGFCSHIYVSRETFEKLSVFHKTLLKWQSSINLISQSTTAIIWQRHILDSAQLFKFVKDVNGNILDFGSGAGFPGLVLAIMGKKNIHLVESDHKKCVFLKEIALLTETDITIHNCRIENLISINVELVTCRALAPLNKLIDYVETYVRKSSNYNQDLPKLLFLKGKSYQNELLQLKKNINFKEFPSITDKESRILYVNNLDTLDVIDE